MSTQAPPDFDRDDPLGLDASHVHTEPFGPAPALTPGIAGTPARAPHPPAGRPGNGGTIATASGLVFVGATDDARFRAFDAKNGKELWTVKLAGAAEATPITSRVGALGIMQVMPQTYDEIRAQYDLGTDPNNPHDNVIAGTAYLQWLYKRYGFPQMFAAYNDGPGNFDRHLSGARELPPETVAYLAQMADSLSAPRSRSRKRLVREARISGADRQRA